MNLTLTDDVRSQNMRVPILGVSTNLHGKVILWPWMKKHWKKLSKKFGAGNPLANRIVASIGSVIDDTMEKDVRVFFRKNPVPGTERTIEQTIERVKIQSQFLSRIRKEFG